MVFIMDGSVPITRKRLVDWAGEQVVAEAEQLVADGLVLEASYEPPLVKGVIRRGSHRLSTAFRLNPDGTIESHCPCWANRERGLVCSHVMAVGVVLVRRATDPQREIKYQQELRRAARLAAVDESAYIPRVPQETPGAMPARLVIALGPDWRQGAAQGRAPIHVGVSCRGQTVPIDTVPTDIPFSFSKRDESLLYVLEDICGAPTPASLELGRADFLNVLRMFAGEGLPREDGRTVTVHKADMTTHIRVRLDERTGELIVNARTELPFIAPGSDAIYLVAGDTGWVAGGENVWPLANVLPAPYHAVYERDILVPRPDVLRFLKQELPALSRVAPVESDISLDLFAIDPAEAQFRLLVRGSPASLSATLYALYGDLELVAGKADASGTFALPDPSDILRYRVRNPATEERALRRVAEAGFSGARGDELSSIVGNREVLNFLGSQFPALRRMGWRVELAGKVSGLFDAADFTVPVVRVNDEPGNRWFDVGFAFEDGSGASITHNEIQLAMRKGESFLRRGSRVVLIDSQAVESMLDVFSDCGGEGSDTPGHFRLSAIYAPFVRSSLEALDGVDIEDTAAWRRRAARCNRSARLQPVALGGGLETVLRPYQKDGVYWLAFLEAAGFCGLLADEMGLGKTVQALAWLSLPRNGSAARRAAALVVCPTSLVENWAQECRRFVPDFRVLALAGPRRHEDWPRIADSDLVVTSYALLRRDLDRYLDIEFSALILDEAQHIKNRSTQNAIAAKQLSAQHKLVLTGTPMENSVADLWSIMDFLMPGYLGKHAVFRANYELPIARGGEDGENAQRKLRRKLHPFLLRRRKSDVAKELPPRIERTAFCSLTPDQRVVYEELLRSSRQRLRDRVGKAGFNRCRMEILTTLMRLRQVCCHLDLLKLPDLSPRYPSAKLDLFLELLDEAVDSGHRILVFSQFVSMLRILRGVLEKRGTSYCYLDGSTKERLSVVQRFNTQRDIPLFLISLKAGGTGLNLTGADMVVHFDPWWNPAVENQATDRAHRIGQQRTVYSVKLITRATVEEKVLALQRRKQDVIDATVESDEDMVSRLTWEDVEQLLAE